MKRLFLMIENLGWNIRSRYALWLHGPYGLAKVIEKMPIWFLISYLKKYGATIGENCRFERGLNLHRPFGEKPFDNLLIGDNVYLGHNTLIDLTRSVTIEDNVIIASRCQIWTHASKYISTPNDILKYSESTGSVHIKKSAIIYSGVIIKHGITIGERSETGAGSIIITDIPANSFYAGSPAKEKKVQK